MNKYWSKVTNRLIPYVPGEQPKDKKYIKLNTNENPYPPSPKVVEAIRKAADDSLRLYPDPTCSGLRAAAAEYYGMKAENVFVGNGSDELLAFAFLAFFNPGKPILFPDITYTFYPVYSNLYNIDYRLVPLDDEFNIPIKPFMEENGGIIFPNPNAPTGKYLPLDSIRNILEYNMDNVVVVDEAYIDYGGEPAIRLINGYPNLLITRTLSKSHSLAGLRVGFALGHKDLIEGLDRIKNSFNSYTVDRLTLAGAEEALKDEAYSRGIRQKVIATRDKLTVGMKQIGFSVIDSAANFVFAGHEKVPGNTLYTQLKEKGILVRYFNKPRIENFIRVSIGTDKDMERFLEAAKEIIAACFL